MSDRKRLGKDSESFENCIMSMFGYIDNDKDKVRRMVKNILSPALGRPAEHLHFETIPVPKTKDLFAIIRPEIMKQLTFHKSGRQLSGVASVTSLQKYPVLL